jgi:hypothetical protein
MEITAQIAALEEEVKLLKGEIKTILEEIRTSVLARDNPFEAGGSLRIFQPIERSGATGEPPEEALPGPAPVTADQAEDTPPGVMPAEPTTAPPAAWEGPSAMPRPDMAAGAPQVAAPAPIAGAGSQAAPETPMATGNPRVMPTPPAPEAPARWSVSTIASLVAWVDETTSRLDTTHLHIVLDLARFAGLLPQEAEEALIKVIKLASSRKDSAGVSVNDTLVALRQLEAIVQEPGSDELTVLRRRRNAGRNP